MIIEAAFAGKSAAFSRLDETAKLIDYRANPVLIDGWVNFGAGPLWRE
jgi:hypothetical protein